MNVMFPSDRALGGSVVLGVAADGPKVEPTVRAVEFADSNAVAAMRAGAGGGQDEPDSPHFEERKQKEQPEEEQADYGVHEESHQHDDCREDDQGRKDHAANPSCCEARK